MKHFLVLITLCCLVSSCNLLDVNPKATDHLTPVVPPGPDTSSAEWVFANKCAPCHGDSGQGLAGLGVGIQQDSVNVTQFVKNGGRMMLPFPELTDSQIIRLKAFIMKLSYPTTGYGLFMRNCATCHGTDAWGTQMAPGLIGDTTLWNTVHNGSGYDSRSHTYRMDPLPQLTGAQVTLIGQWLSTQRIPNDGDTLYSVFCNYCHGNPKALETSTLQSWRTTLSRSHEIMPAFTWLSKDQVDSVYVYVKR